MTVGATVTEVSRSVEPNYQRLDISIVNTGAIAASLGIDTEAVSGKGVYLAAGGIVSWTVTQGYPAMNKRITAVGNGATLAVYERLIPCRSR